MKTPFKILNEKSVLDSEETNNIIDVLHVFIFLKTVLR